MRKHKTERVSRKRKWLAIISISMSVLLCGTMSGCKQYWQDYLPEYENELYRYAVYEKKDAEQRGYYFEEDKTTRGFIIGFTDFAAQQKFLILPNEINGIPIVDFGYQRNQGLMGTEDIWTHLGSKKLEKLYIPFSIGTGQWKGGASGVSIPNCYLVQWKGRNIYLLRRGMNYDRIVSGDAAVSYFSDGLNTDTYYGRDKLANIIYKLNYRNASDDGYYWVDSYDSSVIEFIPPVPTREGYRFEGWYKEPECIDSWDFETDKTGAEIKILKNTILEDYDDCEVTNLYAKWIKN